MQFEEIHGLLKRLKIRFLEIKKTALNLVRFVVSPGIEPGTHGFSVHCSTN